MTMKIGVMLWNVGVHPAAWRHPLSPPAAEISLPFWIELARTAEAAKLDFIFRADTPNCPEGDADAVSRRIMGQFEPITLMSAIAAATTHIGLAATASTSFCEPYNVARQFLSLDHLSGGRAAWNVVTSSAPAAALNFSQPKLEAHGRRYERANEHVDIVLGLWDSWDEDAFIRDKLTGIYYQATKQHRLDHRGAFYSVRGPLDLPRSPQGRPIVLNAGGSDAGMELAARTADVVFSVDRNLEKAKGFYRNLKNRMAKYNRSPQELKVLCAINPYIGETVAEGEEKLDRLQQLIHPLVGLDILAADLGIDMRGLELDAPIPETMLPKSSNLTKSYFDHMVEAIHENRPTLRQLYLACASARGGMNGIAGSGWTIADKMEEWYTAGAADGFMVRVPQLPGGLDDFVRLVVPELQRRGHLRTDYEGKTLRENLDLTQPRLRYQQTRPER